MAQQKVGTREELVKKEGRREKRKCWEQEELDGPGWGNSFMEYLKQGGEKNWFKNQGEGDLPSCSAPFPSRIT